MSPKTWILTDVDRDIYVDHISLGPGQVGGPATGYSVTKRTLRGGLREGVDVVEVDNGCLRLRHRAQPGHGNPAGRLRRSAARLAIAGQGAGPSGLRFHPRSTRLWLDRRVLTSCWSVAAWRATANPEFTNGVLRYPLHGEVANLPAHTVAVAIDGHSGEIIVSGVVDEARFFGNKLH